MTRRLLLGFLGGLSIFLLINILAAQWMSDCGLAAVLRIDACSDDIVRVGWPFQFFEEGGIGFRSIFSSTRLALDVFLGVLAAVLAGLAVSSRLFRSKRL